MARTAVIAGTATAVSGGVSRRQAAKAEQKQDASQQEQQQQWEAQQQWAAQQQAATPPPPPAASGGLDDSGIEKLKELAALHEQGVLTDDEFAAQKAKILG